MTITRPITIWGPGMNAHYQRFFKLIKKRYYFMSARGRCTNRIGMGAT
jgi:hypothetical protein